MPHQDIPSLDGIRALAVALVVTAHLGLGDRVPGGFGVTVFFFLSGFLITTLLRAEFERTGRVSLRRFYLRRALRLLPPFYLVLGLGCLATAAGLIGSHGLRLEAVLPQLFYGSNYEIIHSGWSTGRAPGTDIFWSLAIEEHFYLVFPLLYLLLRRRGQPGRSQLVILMTLCATVLAWRCLLVYGLHSGLDRTYVATDTRVDSILFGCALAVYGNPVLDRGAGDHRRLRRVWLPLGVVVLLLTFVVRSEQMRETIRYTLQGLALVPIFVCAIRYPRWGVFRVLNLRAVRFIGELSYSIYLVHLTVIDGLQNRRLDGVPPLGRAALAVLLTLLLTVAIHRFVERPCARWRRRLSSAAVEAAAAPVHPLISAPLSAGL